MNVNAVLFRVVNITVFAEIKEFLTRPGDVDLLRNFFIESEYYNQQFSGLVSRDRLTTVDFQPDIVSSCIDLDLGVILFFRLAPWVCTVRIGLSRFCAVLSAHAPTLSARNAHCFFFSLTVIDLVESFVKRMGKFDGFDLLKLLYKST